MSFLMMKHCEYSYSDQCKKEDTVVKGGEGAVDPALNA